MRAIGKLDSEQQARTFGDFLLVEGIENEIDQSGDRSWTIWVHSEDQIEDARRLLDRFAQNPDAVEFSSAASTARGLKRLEKKKTARSRKHYVDVRTTWSSATVMRPGPLTLGLIGASILVALLSRLGADNEVLQYRPRCGAPRGCGLGFPFFRTSLEMNRSHARSVGAIRRASRRTTIRAVYTSFRGRRGTNAPTHGERHA